MTSFSLKIAAIFNYGFVTSFSLKIAALHCFQFSTIQISVTFLFSFTFDQVCGRLHGFIRAFITDSLAFNVAVPFSRVVAVCVLCFFLMHGWLVCSL